MMVGAVYSAVKECAQHLQICLHRKSIDLRKGYVLKLVNICTAFLSVMLNTRRDLGLIAHWPKGGVSLHQNGKLICRVCHDMHLFQISNKIKGKLILKYCDNMIYNSMAVCMGFELCELM